MAHVSVAEKGERRVVLRNKGNLKICLKLLESNSSTDKNTRVLTTNSPQNHIQNRNIEI